jgi:hypothetical protein
MSDERRNLPSASRMRQIAMCPPSHQMQLHAPKEPESEDAAAGTRIHAVLAGEADESTLNAAELETKEMCERQALQLKDEWKQTERPRIETEQRLWLTSFGTVIKHPSPSAAVIFSGKFDALFIEGDRALLIDYKTGRGDYAEAIDNEQLAANAVLVSLHYGVTEVRTALVQPWVGKPTICDFGSDELQQAKEWLFAKLEAERRSTPDQAKAGDWCQYCTAQLSCHAFRSKQNEGLAVLNVATLAGMDDETQRKAMFARAMELPAAELNALMQVKKLHKQFIAAIEGASRARAESDPEFQRYWTLKEKAGRRSVSNVQGVFNQCLAHGVTADAFTEKCSIGLGDVKELLRNATGKKGKSLDELHTSVLTGNTETGKPTAELVPVMTLED